MINMTSWIVSPVLTSQLDYVYKQKLPQFNIDWTSEEA